MLAQFTWLAALQAQPPVAFTDTLPVPPVELKEAFPGDIA
jgi:hypothetical protein